VWSAPLDGIDVRKWLSGEDWDSDLSAYRIPAETYHATGRAKLPEDLSPGEYILALAILDRQGGLVPSARFAVQNYFSGGWHPFGFIGIGVTPQDTALGDVVFDSPAFDRTLTYEVPKELLAVQRPPVPQVASMPSWVPDPEVQLINPWRYWVLLKRSDNIEKRVTMDGPVDGPAGRRVISVAGDFGQGSNLCYTFFDHGKLAPGWYRFSYRVRGTPGLAARFDVADGWRGVISSVNVPLSQQWREHEIAFEIKEDFRKETRLRFGFPRDASGEFHLTAPQLRRGFR
jgi:hypothetical protein